MIQIFAKFFVKQTLVGASKPFRKIENKLDLYGLSNNLLNKATNEKMSIKDDIHRAQKNLIKVNLNEAPNCFK